MIEEDKSHVRDLNNPKNVNGQRNTLNSNLFDSVLRIHYIHTYITATKSVHSLYFTGAEGL